MEKIYNFSGIQTTLPDDVTARLCAEIGGVAANGLPLLELNGFNPFAEKLMSDTEAMLRELLAVPQSYKILFMQGGATAQRSAVPYNLLSAHRAADYVITGRESKAAYLEGKKYGDMAIAASSAGSTPTFSTVPEIQKSDIRPDADYVHICYNNMVYGTRFAGIPDTGNIPLVADMSTCFLSEPIEITKYGLIYASVQKNVSVPGMTVVIVRDDLVGHARPDTPRSLDYAIAADRGTGRQSPVMFSLYVTSLVLRGILDAGGLDEMKRRNESKASLLYDYLDSQTYYTAPADKKYRSLTSVVFITGNAKLDELFVAEAAKAGLVNLDGHSSIGGLRASLTNALPYEGVQKLVRFMKDFSYEHPKSFL